MKYILNRTKKLLIENIKYIFLINISIVLVILSNRYSLHHYSENLIGFNIIKELSMIEILIKFILLSYIIYLNIKNIILNYEMSINNLYLRIEKYKFKRLIYFSCLILTLIVSFILIIPIIVFLKKIVIINYLLYNILVFTITFTIMFNKNTRFVLFSFLLFILIIICEIFYKNTLLLIFLNILYFIFSL